MAAQPDRRRTGVPLEWYAGGASRPQLTKIAADAFRQFGVPVWAEPSAKPPAGDLGRFYWFLPGVVAQSNDFANMHTAGDTPEIVPPSGLEAVTRAYAKIIDDVNRIDLKALQAPEPADPNKPGTPEGYLSLANCEAWISDLGESLRAALITKNWGRDVNRGPEQ